MGLPLSCLVYHRKYKILPAIGTRMDPFRFDEFAGNGPENKKIASGLTYVRATPQIASLQHDQQGSCKRKKRVEPACSALPFACLVSPPKARQKIHRRKHAPTDTYDWDSRIKPDLFQDGSERGSEQICLFSRIYVWIRPANKRV